MNSERLHQLRAQYWRQTRNLTHALLLLWASIVFGAVYFARELSGMTLFGWPLSFYLAAQGALLVFLAIIGGYAWRMRVLDKRFREAVR